jgi:ubiquinone/menaquinone biosynthesis C-methylase UbiE
MRADTLALLRAPGTHEPLRLAAAQGAGGGEQEVLVGAISGARYPVRDGIPMLLDEALVSGPNQRYQRFYNRVAGAYDGAIKLVAALAGRGEKRFRMEYLRELEARDGDRVLEVSIGTGANLQFLPAGAFYYGLDLSWGMLMRCQKNLKRWRRQAELIMGNAEGLPLRDEAFGAVLQVGGITAFNDRAKAIREMVRVARAGARIVIVDETAKLMEALRWLPPVRRLLRDYSGRFAAPVQLVPEGMLEVRVREIAKGNLYCLTFRKP